MISSRVSRKAVSVVKFLVERDVLSEAVAWVVRGLSNRPPVPVLAGVLITASDVFILLALKDPLGGKPVRLFEIIIGALVSHLLDPIHSQSNILIPQVFTVLVCMAIIIAQVHVRWGDAFDGFLPSGSLFKSGALYTCKLRTAFHR